MVITSFTQAIEASRPHATTNSSKFPVRSNDAPTLAGSYHVDILHGATDFSVDENIVEDGLQQIPLAGTAELEPGYLQIATVVNERKNDWDAHSPHVEFLTPIP